MSSSNCGKNRCVCTTQNLRPGRVRRYLVGADTNSLLNDHSPPLGLGRRVGKTDPTAPYRGGIAPNDPDSYKGGSLYRMQVSTPYCLVVAPLMLCVTYPSSRRKKKVCDCGASQSVHLTDRLWQRCDGARPACSLCAKSRTGTACVYEMSSSPISVLGETAEPMRISPPSLSVGLPDSAPPLTSEGRSKGLSLDVNDFEDPFSSDISTMPREKATLRL